MRTALVVLISIFLAMLLIALPVLSTVALVIDESFIPNQLKKNRMEQFVAATGG